MKDSIKLEKLLASDELKNYSNTYFLITECLITIQKDDQYPPHEKVKKIVAENEFLYRAKLIHEWTTEFELKHIEVIWNGDYIKAVWDFVVVKLKSI